MPIDKAVPANDLPDNLVPADDLPASLPGHGSSGSWDAPPEQSLARAKSIIGPMVNPVNIAKGLAHQVANPVEAVQQGVQGAQDTWGAAEDAFSEKQYGRALMKAVLSGVPFMGPAASKAADKINQGDWVGGISEAIGTGLQGAEVGLAGKAVGAVAKPVANALAEPVSGAVDSVAGKLYKSVYKPRAANVGDIDEALAVGRKEGIAPTRGGASKLDAAIQSTGQSIGDVIDNGNGATVRTADIQAAMDAAKQNLPKSQRNAFDNGAEDIWSEVRNPDGSLPPEISVQDAHGLKVKAQDWVVKSKKTFYSGEGGAPSTEAWASASRNIGDQIVDQFPELKDANARYSALKDFEPIFEAAKNRIGNRELGGGFLTAAGVGAELAHGNMGAAGAILGAKILTSPILRAKFATAVSNASGGSVSGAIAVSKLAGIVAAAKEQPQADFPKAADANPGDRDRADFATSVVGGQLARNAKGQFLSAQDRLSDFAKP